MNKSALSYHTLIRAYLLGSDGNVECKIVYSLNEEDVFE